MRLGLLTPVLVMRPRAHARWEEDAGIEEVATVAKAADRLGYDVLTCSEHVAIPRDAAPVRGSTYWDPLATFGYLAACTERIRFATYVLVLAYHHPLAIAKRYGTLDRVTKGRLILGVGVGTLREEFDLLGVPFRDRGIRADDALRALRASLGKADPSYAGTHYRYDGFIVDPAAEQHRVPIWIGGQTERSLRRAVELGDGWAPFNIRFEDAPGLLSRARDTEAYQRREGSLEVVLICDRTFDPLSDSEGAAAALERARAAGATLLTCRFVHHSLAHYLEQIEALASVARKG